MGDQGPTAVALQLDSHAALLAFHRSIVSEANDPSALHIFQHRNALFSVHGSENVSLAIRLNVEDFRTVSELPPCPPIAVAPLQTIYFSAQTAQNLARTALFTAGKRIRVFDVGSDGRAISRCQGSPGNMSSLEECFFDQGQDTTLPGQKNLEDGVVMTVKISSAKSLTQLGVCTWDASARTLAVTHSYEDDVFSNLEGFLVATNTREVIFCESDVSEFEKAKILDVVEKCGVAMTLVDKKQFTTSNVGTDLQRLVGSQLSTAHIMDNSIMVSAIGALLNYGKLTVDSQLEGKVTISEMRGDTYMKLDNAVMRALNILPFPGDGGKKGSLYGLMNCTKNSMGSRLLRRWLSQPLQSVEEINARLDITTAFVDGNDCCRAIRDDHLNLMPDINWICRKFTKNNGSKASLQDVVRLYQCSVRLPLISAALKTGGNAKVARRFSAPLKALASELRNFEALVETTIDLDQIENGEFVISPVVDTELQRLREQQDSIISDINDEYSSVCRSISGLKGDVMKLERKDNLGYIFRLTRKEEKLIRGKRQFTVLETRKDGVRFQSGGLRRLSESYQEIADEYIEKEREIRLKTLAVAGTYVEVFQEVAALLAELDVLCAFATLAVESRSPYVRPIITPSGSGLVLKQARHPIVEENMQDGVEFIANDLCLSRRSSTAEGENKGGSLLLVTGPNMGGKSTYIRSAGLLTLMAHVGAFVPAMEASVPITDRIFARVGAGDNQHRAISTFMSEMLETAAILRSATSKSLVIIDELGRGTGTMDGYGLAFAISKHIVTRIQCACLFATHFFELTALADNVPFVRNVHVGAITDPRNSKLTFLYEVKAGACDESFGVDVAEMAHFPASVVVAAKRKALELENSDIPMKKLKTARFSEDEMSAGVKLMSDYIATLRKLPLRADDSRVAVIQARTLRDGVRAENNGYLTALLAKQ